MSLLCSHPGAVMLENKLDFARGVERRKFEPGSISCLASEVSFGEKVIAPSLSKLISATSKATSVWGGK